MHSDTCIKIINGITRRRMAKPSNLAKEDKHIGGYLTSTLWHQVILSIYGTHSNGWDFNTTVRWSHRCPWKTIAQVFQDFSKYTRFVVGDGERILFWEDLW